MVQVRARGLISEQTAHTTLPSPAPSPRVTTRREGAMSIRALLSLLARSMDGPCCQEPRC